MKAEQFSNVSGMEAHEPGRLGKGPGALLVGGASCSHKGVNDVIMFGTRGKLRAKTPTTSCS